MPTATAAPFRPAQDTSDHAILAEVAAEFDLGRVDDWSVVTEGLLNRNWKITVSGASYAVKQVLDVTAEQARQQHAATECLAERGLPVPAPLRTRTGKTLWEAAHGNFCVLPWITGTHVAGRDWTLDQAAHVGHLLAQLHVVLAEVMPPVTAVAARAKAPEPEKAKHAIDRYLGIIASRAAQDPFDVLVERRLRQRRDLLESVVHLRPDDTALVKPYGWVHGDFHDLNLLWSGNAVVAVIDWDRLSVRPLAAEVVRSATLLFATGDERGLLLGHVAAFAAAYRRVRPLAVEDLADAAHRLWWERVCDLWQLKRHYDQDDVSCDHLFVSACQLLEWWSEHRDGVTAALAS